jgi:hypothetical protein
MSLQEILDAQFGPPLSDETAPPISISRFIDVSGISPVTAWRWEQRGWLRTVRIAGRKYITATDLREFNRRLNAGEFAGTVANPSAQRAKKEGGAK